MASKRPLDAASEGSTPEEPQFQPKKKRAKMDASANAKRLHQSAHMDATWGQKYFFPSHEAATSIPQDDELAFEDDADAMAYLRTVRNQASGIPHLLVAPKIGPQLPPGEDEDDSDGSHRDMYEDGTGDFRGYYYDGAYTAAPDQDYDEEYEYGADEYMDGEYYGDEDGEEARSANISEAYFASLRDSFLDLRKILHATPPPDIVAALPRSHSPFVGPLGTKSPTFEIWSKKLRTTDPLPAQVASMDRDGVLRVLRIIMGGKFLRVGKELRERTSRWLWALLARLPDRGEMSHTDVAWVRDLGKRAVLVSRSLAEMAALREQLEDEGKDLGVNEAFDDSEDDEEVMKETAVDETEEDPGTSSQSGSVETNAQTDQDEAQHGTDAAAAGNTQQSAQSANVKEHKAEPAEKAPSEALEEGEHEDDVPMDLEEEEGGKASETEDLETVKARLLSRLDEFPSKSPVSDYAEEREATFRARMNMRATLNMIITVAGEFYGQLDLLEFRDPFTSSV